MPINRKLVGKIDSFILHSCLKRGNWHLQKDIKNIRSEIARFKNCMYNVIPFMLKYNI